MLTGEEIEVVVNNNKVPDLNLHTNQQEKIRSPLYRDPDPSTASLIPACTVLVAFMPPTSMQEVGESQYFQEETYVVSQATSRVDARG